MIERATYDLLRGGVRLVLQLWLVWAVWWGWSEAGDFWGRQVAAAPGGIRFLFFHVPQSFLGQLLPLLALTGPALVMVAVIAIHRVGPGSRAMALAGVAGLAITAVLTGWSEVSRLWPFLGDPRYSIGVLINAFDGPKKYALVIGLMAAFIGYCIATRAWPVGSRPSRPLLRGNSDVHGHAAWLSMQDAKRLFSGPDPAYGGIVVGEAYRVDEDAVARRGRFDPRDKRSWGRGGTAPLLIDPCHIGSTHALVFAGSGGFKTTSIGIPTLLTWIGSAVVLDPSREIGPMVAEYRRQTLGHRVVLLDPATAKESGVNVLDWIDITSPLADTHVDSVVNWITTEHRDGTAGKSDFFPGSARDLITCVLTDLLWDPTLPPEQKTLRTFQRRLVTPEKQMRQVLSRIHQTSASIRARDLAGTLMEQHEETFSGVYGNANRDARWLSTPAFADLVSGGAEGSMPAMRTGDLVSGKVTAFLQIPLPVLLATPALGRVLVGALLNAVYEADGQVAGRVLFLLDEVASLGYMRVLDTARNAGRKYGVTLLLLYQSLGQLAGQWGREGKQAWFDSTAWQLFAAVQDWDTARELSAMCGDYGVVATSTGDTEGSQSRGALGGSSSSGRSENRSEVKRALIKPEELRNDTRADEAFILASGSSPLRCGRAIWFRRPEWAGLVQANRFHRDSNDRDAAE